MLWQGRSLNKYINQYPEHEQERTTQNHENINVINSIHSESSYVVMFQCCVYHILQENDDLPRAQTLFCCDCVSLVIFRLFRVFPSKKFSRT